MEKCTIISRKLQKNCVWDARRRHSDLDIVGNAVRRSRATNQSWTCVLVKLSMGCSDWALRVESLGLSEMMVGICKPGSGSVMGTM